MNNVHVLLAAKTDGAYASGAHNYNKQIRK